MNGSFDFNCNYWPNIKHLKVSIIYPNLNKGCVLLFCQCDMWESKSFCHSASAADKGSHNSLEHQGLSSGTFNVPIQTRTAAPAKSHRPAAQPKQQRRGQNDNFMATQPSEYNILCRMAFYTN